MEIAVPIQRIQFLVLEVCSEAIAGIVLPKLFDNLHQLNSQFLQVR